MKMLISGEIPVADAATPKAIPNGTTNAATGAISTLPRHTPPAVKRGRWHSFESDIFPAIESHLRRGRSSGQSTQAGGDARSRRQVTLHSLVPPISSSYSGCGKVVKELEIEKRH